MLFFDGKTKSSEWISFNIFLLVMAIIIAMLAGIFFIIKGEELKAATTETDDLEPPLIYDVKIEKTSATSSTIAWKTNEEADSLINFGLDKNYGIVRNPSTYKKDHSLEIPNLEPNRTYYFRITSSDASGNQGISSNYLFVTKPESSKTEEEQQKTDQGTGLKNEGQGMGEGEKNEYGQGMGEGETNAEGRGRGEGETGNEGEGQGEGSTGTEGQGKGEGELGIEGLGAGISELAKTEEGRQLLQAFASSVQNTDGNPQSMAMLAERLTEIGQGPFEAPIIIEGYPEIAEVGTDYVIVRWLTTVDANSIVALATEEAFNPDASDPYQWKEGEPDEYVSTHEVEISGLEPATTYHYQVQSRGRVGPQVKSPDRVFTTKSVVPQIFNINIEKVEEDSATISWTTNVPCSSVIEYTNLATNETRSEGSPNFVTRHNIRLSSLQFDTPYSAVINVENEQGEKTKAQPLSFTTVKDEVPPVISKLTTESTLYPGAETKIQTIISWETDESSVCQFFYHQGILQADQKPENLPPETGLVTKHIQVVTAFQPASVYKFWITCKDRTGNQAKSEDFTMLTPQKEQSILDLIISNFEGTFGWMKNMVPNK